MRDDSRMRHHPAMTITRVWIDEGCIACGACPLTCPTVFAIPDGDAEVLGTARMDGITSPNRSERCQLNAAGRAQTAEIEEAAEGCPVDVIRFMRSDVVAAEG